MEMRDRDRELPSPERQRQRQRKRQRKRQRLTIARDSAAIAINAINLKSIFKELYQSKK